MTGLSKDDPDLSCISDPFNLIRLPGNFVKVEDPEEEIFLLYTQLQSKGAQDGSHAFTGLGSLDSKHDTLSINFNLPPVPQVNEPIKEHTGRKRHSKKQSLNVSEDNELEIELAQDKTSLRSKKGDTGSVVWRVSVGLGQALLGQILADSMVGLVGSDQLRLSNVLELGAGTGLLSIILAPFVRHYTVTDLEYLLPLIRKNISHNLPSAKQAFKKYIPGAAPSSESSSDNLTIDSLDWLHLHRTPPSSRSSIFRLPHDEPLDLILAVDCIYNPALLPAFVETLDYFSEPGRTKALVAVELRSEDVIREFLELWIAKGEWEIWRIGSEGESGNGLLDASFAVWIGRKVCTDATQNLPTM